MNRLADAAEQAATEGVVILLRDGQVRYRGEPSPELLEQLRHHRREIGRRLRSHECCWCPDDPRPAWFADADTGLPICRRCVGPVGERRLDREGFDRSRVPDDAKGA